MAKVLLTSWLWLVMAIVGLVLFFLSEFMPFEVSAGAYLLLGILSAAFAHHVWFGKRR
jgi:hypothetical protein